MNNRSRATFFLMEQLIVIFVFAVCSVICVTLFASAYTTACESRDTRSALIIAQNAAECFKAAEGVPEETVRLLGFSDPAADLYYGGNCKASGQDDAAYILRLAFANSDIYSSLRLCDIAVCKPNGEELYSLSAAARG